MTRDDIVAALERAASEDYLYEPDVRLLRALADALREARTDGSFLNEVNQWEHGWWFPEPKVKP